MHKLRKLASCNVLPSIVNVSTKQSTASEESKTFYVPITISVNVLILIIFVTRLKPSIVYTFNTKFYTTDIH